MLNEVSNYNNSLQYNKNSQSVSLNKNLKSQSYYNEPTYTEQYNQKLNYSTEKKTKLNNSKYSKKKFKGRRIGDNKDDSFQKNKSIDNILIDNLFTPKTKFTFSYTPLCNRSLNNISIDNTNNNINKNERLKKSKSYNKLNPNNSNLIKNKIKHNTSIYSSIQSYWQRREIEKINKLENIKNENLKKK